MNTKDRKIFYLTASILSLFSILLPYWRETFAVRRLSDPLALSVTLFPFYYIMLGGMTIACSLTLYTNSKNRILMVFQLLSFAVILWFTPYYISGFARDPDTMWKMGESIYFQSISEGVPMLASTYPSSYPGAFLWNHAFLNIGGVSSNSYMYYFPLFALFVIVISLFSFGQRLLTARKAFAGVLLAISTMFYVQLHPGPWTFALFFLLASLSLLATKKKDHYNTISISILAIGILFCHSISAILFGSFFFIYAVSSSITSKVGERLLSRNLIIALAIGALFVLQIFFFVEGGTATVSEKIVSIFSRSLFIRSGGSGTFSFYYEWIFQLNLLIYAMMFFSMLISVFLWDSRPRLRALFSKSIIKEVRGMFLGKRIRVFLLGSAIISLFLGFLFSSVSYVLLQRGIFLFLFFTGLTIANDILPKIKDRAALSKGIAVAAVILFIFMSSAYPIISYALENYTSTPYQEGRGIEILANDISLNGKSVAMGVPRNVIYYNPFLTETEFEPLHNMNAPNLNSSSPDIIIFQSTSYYYSILRWDKSFEDNRWSHYEEYIEENEFSKVYTNPYIDIYETT